MNPIDNLLDAIDILNPEELNESATMKIYKMLENKVKEARKLRTEEIKGRLAVGDKVYFVSYRSEKETVIFGTVTKVNRTKAIISTEEGSYNVPISMINFG